MTLIENLIDYFKKPNSDTNGQSPQGICNACWGYQEYDRKIRQLIHDEQIDVNNHQRMYSMIQDFVVNHIDGIRLKDFKVENCAHCGTKTP